MASISTHKDGTRRLFFTDKRGERHAIHLGRLPKKQAEAIKRRVEQLIYHSVAGQPWDTELSTWVESIGESLADKFATHGLMQPRETRKLGDFLESLLEGRKAYGLKPSTILNYRQVANDLNDRIGKDRHLRDITPEVAEAFKIYYQSDRKLAATTVHRRIKLIRRCFYNQSCPAGREIDRDQSICCPVCCVAGRITGHGEGICQPGTWPLR